MTRLLGLLAACATLGGAWLTAHAPFQTQTTPPQFRSSVDMVLVDVSVLDRRRQPIRGLTAADFTVLEDGVPQKVEAFEAFEVADPPAPPARWMARAPFDVQRNDMPPGRLVVIFMNDRVSVPDPFLRRTARETAHAVIDQLGPDDVAAVAFTINYGAAQEFTTDRARLHAAVDNYDSNVNMGGSVPAMLRDLAALLGAIPERRKLIIYIGPGVGFDLEVMNTLDRVTAEGGSGLNSLQRDDQLQQYDFLMNLFRIAQRSNVGIYMVNPAGLAPPDAAGRLPVATHDFMRLVAANTGARAIVNNNAPAQEMAGVLRENGAYYLLGYRSTDTRREGRFRRIEVKVNRPNVEVRSRRGYIEPRPGQVLAGPAAPGQALSRLIPRSDLSVGLWASAVSAGPAGEHPVAIALTVDVPRGAEPVQQSVNVSYAIVDMQGREQWTDRHTLAVSSVGRGTDPGAVTTQILGKWWLPPGRYDIRVAANVSGRDVRGGLVGDVVVPDFAREALSLTGVILTETTPPPSMPGDALADILPAVPTTRRVFAQTADVTASLRAYQAGRNTPSVVTIRTSILNAQDKAVVEATHRLEPAAFAGGTGAEYRTGLPLARLAPGPYLLRIDATRSGAQAVRREVRFEVK